MQFVNLANYIIASYADELDFCLLVCILTDLRDKRKQMKVRKADGSRT